MLLLYLVKRYILTGQGTSLNRLLRMTTLTFLYIGSFLIMWSFMSLFLVLVIFRHLLQML